MERECDYTSAEEIWKAVCNINTFSGIALTSLVSKVLCKILENRLSHMAEEQGLIEEEQGGGGGGRGFGKVEAVETKFFHWC